MLLRGESENYEIVLIKKFCKVVFNSVMIQKKDLIPNYRQLQNFGKE